MSNPTTMQDLYPVGCGYHDAHEAYIGAVAAALEAGGVEVLDWHADPNDPRDGAIQVRPAGALAKADEVWIGWQEERGWWLVTEYERPGEENSKFVYEFTCASVASPESVAVSAREQGLPWDGPADSYPDEDFPEHYFDTDNVPLELALRRYAEAGGA